MSEVKQGGLVAAVAHAASTLAHTPLPYFLGVALLFAATKWDGSLYDRKGCVQLQEAAGTVYKVDSCTGKTEELKPRAPLSPASAAPASSISNRP